MAATWLLSWDWKGFPFASQALWVIQPGAQEETGSPSLSHLHAVWVRPETTWNVLGHLGGLAFVCFPCSPPGLIWFLM